MRYIELFAGIGGFRYGLEKANDTVTERTQQGIQQGSKSNNTIVKPFMGTKQFTRNRNILQSKTSKSIQKTMSCIKEGETRFTCVYANEWDKYACQIYWKNFGKGELYEGDITKVSAETIPNHDFLTAGFPCPTYSIAGKRKGFKDPRGIVFFEICRIAEVKKPALLLLENVKGLLNHDKGNTFRIILSSLSELGYDCEWEVLNSKNFRVPQNRERVFIVGHLGGTSGQKVFPIGEGNRGNNERTKQTTNVRTLQGGGHSGGHHSGMTLLQINNNVSDAQRVFNPEGIATTLKALGGGQGAKTGLYMNTLTEAIGTRQGSSKEFIKSVKNINKAIGQIRRLTPTECERLQGFPDGWTEGISDTQRYKCLGNAVTTNVITEIGKKILRR